MQKKNRWRKRREQLEKQNASWLAKYNANQDSCPHENLFYKYGCGDNAWSGSVFDYWFDWICTDCNKRWTTPQNLEELKKYPHAQRVENFCSTVFK